MLEAERGGNYIDATIGEGGHTNAILRANRHNVLLGIDRDPEVLEEARRQLFRFKKRVTFCSGRASQVMSQKGVRAKQWHGILIDAGVSSWHLEKSGRGFSFQREEALDMRLSFDEGRSAQELLNTLSKKELKNIFLQYGQEGHAGTIASRIVERRPLQSTGELVEAIRAGLPSGKQEGRRHPATRIFQAVRLAVNQELEELQLALRAAWQLQPFRIAVIVFHSLEEQEVRKFLRHLGQNSEDFSVICAAQAPSEQEIYNNPRSRSAKLYGVSRPQQE